MVDQVQELIIFKRPPYASAQVKTNPMYAKRMRLPNGKSIKHVSHCGSFVTVISEDNTLYSWGALSKTFTTTTDAPHMNLIEILTGDPENISSLNQVSISNLSFCGQTAVIAITESGDLLSWGYDPNRCGILGHGPETFEISHPCKISSVSSRTKFIQASCSPRHCAAIDESNNLFTWGSQKFDELGYLQEECQFKPRQAVNGSMLRPKRVACGDFVTYLLTGSGKLFTYGAINSRLVMEGESIQTVVDLENPLHLPCSEKIPKGIEDERMQLISAVDHELDDLNNLTFGNKFTLSRNDAWSCENQCRPSILSATSGSTDTLPSEMSKFTNQPICEIESNQNLVAVLTQDGTCYFSTDGETLYRTVTKQPLSKIVLHSNYIISAVFKWIPLAPAAIIEWRISSTKISSRIYVLTHSLSKNVDICHCPSELFLSLSRSVVTTDSKGIETNISPTNVATSHLKGKINRIFGDLSSYTTSNFDITEGSKKSLPFINRESVSNQARDASPTNFNQDPCETSVLTGMTPKTIRSFTPDAKVSAFKAESPMKFSTKPEKDIRPRQSRERLASSPLLLHSFKQHQTDDSFGGSPSACLTTAEVRTRDEKTEEQHTVQPFSSPTKGDADEFDMKKLVKTPEVTKHVEELKAYVVLTSSLHKQRGYATFSEGKRSDFSQGGHSQHTSSQSRPSHTRGKTIGVKQRTETATSVINTRINDLRTQLFRKNRGEDAVGRVPDAEVKVPQEYDDYSHEGHSSKSSSNRKAESKIKKLYIDLFGEDKMKSGSGSRKNLFREENYTDTHVDSFTPSAVTPRSSVRSPNSDFSMGGFDSSDRLNRFTMGKTHHRKEFEQIPGHQRGAQGRKLRVHPQHTRALDTSESDRGVATTEEDGRSFSEVPRSVHDLLQQRKKKSDTRKNDSLVDRVTKCRQQECKNPIFKKIEKVYINLQEDVETDPEEKQRYEARLDRISKRDARVRSMSPNEDDSYMLTDKSQIGNDREDRRERMQKKFEEIFNTLQQVPSSAQRNEMAKKSHQRVPSRGTFSFGNDTLQLDFNSLNFSQEKMMQDGVKVHSPSNQQNSGRLFGDENIRIEVSPSEDPSERYTNTESGVVISEKYTAENRDSVEEDPNCHQGGQFFEGYVALTTDSDAHDSNAGVSTGVRRSSLKRLSAEDEAEDDNNWENIVAHTRSNRFSDRQVVGSSRTPRAENFFHEEEERQDDFAALVETSTKQEVVIRVEHEPETDEGRDERVLLSTDRNEPNNEVNDDLLGAPESPYRSFNSRKSREVSPQYTMPRKSPGDKYFRLSLSPNRDKICTSEAELNPKYRLSLTNSAQRRQEGSLELSQDDNFERDEGGLFSSVENSQGEIVKETIVESLNQSQPYDDEDEEQRHQDLIITHSGEGSTVPCSNGYNDLYAFKQQPAERIPTNKEDDHRRSTEEISASDNGFVTRDEMKKTKVKTPDRVFRTRGLNLNQEVEEHHYELEDMVTPKEEIKKLAKASWKDKQNLFKVVSKFETQEVVDEKNLPVLIPKGHRDCEKYDVTDHFEEFRFVSQRIEIAAIQKQCRKARPNKKERRKKDKVLVDLETYDQGLLPEEYTLRSAKIGLDDLERQPRRLLSTFFAQKKGQQTSVIIEESIKLAEEVTKKKTVLKSQLSDRSLSKPVTSGYKEKSFDAEMSKQISRYHSPDSSLMLKSKEFSPIRIEHHDENEGEDRDLNTGTDDRNPVESVSENSLREDNIDDANLRKEDENMSLNTESQVMGDWDTHLARLREDESEVSEDKQVEVCTPATRLSNRASGLSQGVMKEIKESKESFGEEDHTTVETKRGQNEVPDVKSPKINEEKEMDSAMRQALLGSEGQGGSVQSTISSKGSEKEMLNFYFNVEGGSDGNRRSITNFNATSGENSAQTTDRVTKERKSATMSGRLSSPTTKDLSRLTLEETPTPQRLSVEAFNEHKVTRGRTSADSSPSKKENRQSLLSPERKEELNRDMETKIALPRGSPRRTQERLREKMGRIYSDFVLKMNCSPEHTTDTSIGSPAGKSALSPRNKSSKGGEAEEEAEAKKPQVSKASLIQKTAIGLMAKSGGTKKAGKTIKTPRYGKSETQIPKSTPRSSKKNQTATITTTNEDDLNESLTSTTSKTSQKKRMATISIDLSQPKTTTTKPTRSSKPSSKLQKSATTVGYAKKSTSEKSSAASTPRHSSHRNGAGSFSKQATTISKEEKKTMTYAEMMAAKGKNGGSKSFVGVKKKV